MKRFKPQVLEHAIIIEGISEDEYDRLMEWMRDNVSTVNRRTPEYSGDKKMRFYFRFEEDAMGFKLVAPNYALK